MSLGLGSKLTKGGVDPYSMYRSRHSVRFDGTNDFLEIADSTTFDHVSGGDSQFTLACWFKLDALPSLVGENMTLMSKWVGTGDKREWLLYITTGNKISFVLSSDGTNDSSGDSDDTMVHNNMGNPSGEGGQYSLSDTKWHHVMVSYNGAPSQSIGWYFDGQLMGSVNDGQLDSDFEAINQDDAPVRIGGYNDGTSYPMLGYIADPIYLNRLVAGGGTAKYFYNKGKPRNLSRYEGYPETAVHKEAYWQMGDNKYDVKHADGTDHAIVDATEGVGPNLITNGTFDENALGWTQISGASLYNAENGGSAKVDIDASSTHNGMAQNITYSSGKHYRVTFDAKGSATNQIRVQDNATYSDSALYATGTNFTLTTDWKTYSFTWTADSNSDIIRIERQDGSSWHYFIDNVKLYELKGDVAISKNMTKGIVAESPGIGRDSYSYSFDSTNHYVDVGPSNALITGNTVTVAFWAKITDTDGAYAFANVRGNAASNFSVALNRNGASNSAGWITGYVYSGSSLNTVTYDGNIDDSQWHHYAFTTSASAQVLYLDGAAVATGSNTFSNSAHADHNNHIGNLKGDSYYLGGYISDMVLFNTTLTAAQVRENMGPGLDLNNLSTGSDITAWWRFGDGTLDYKRDDYAHFSGCLGDENNPTLGSDLLGGKGDFSDPSYWTVTSGGTIIENGKGKFLGNGEWALIKKAGILTAGDIYEIMIDVDEFDADFNARVSVSFSTDSYPHLHPNNTTGKGFKTYVKANDADLEIYINSQGGAGTYWATATIDNVIVRKVNGFPGHMANMAPADIAIEAP